MNFDDDITKKYLLVSFVINLGLGFYILTFSHQTLELKKDCKKEIVTIEKKIFIDRYIKVASKNEDKIVIKDENISTYNKELIMPDKQISVEKEDNKFIIFSSRDKTGKYTISLLSEIPIDKKSSFKRKIIIYGIVNDEKSSKYFTMMFPPSVLEDINTLSLKITNNADNNSFEETAYCFSDMQSGYNYNFEINYSPDGIDCYITSSIKTKPIEEIFTTNINRIKNLKISNKY